MSALEEGQNSAFLLNRNLWAYSNTSRLFMMNKFSSILGPPKGVKDVMNDPDEIEKFQAFKSTTGGTVHSTLSEPTQYNSQRAEWRSVPSQ
jgi:hypothetical protein